MPNKHYGNLEVLGRVISKEHIVGASTDPISATYKLPPKGNNGDILQLVNGILSFTPTVSGSSQSIIISSDNSITVTSIPGGYDLTLTPPIVPLSITSFTGGGIFEKGSVVNSVNLAWVYNQSNQNPNTSQSINQGVGSLPISQRNYTFSTPISGNTTFTLTGIDSIRGSANASTNISFLNRRYWGVTTASVMTQTDVKAGSSELNENISKDITFNCTGGYYFYYAFPSRLGSLSTYTTLVNGFPFSDWSDNAGGSTISGFLVNVTNASGFTESYRVYRSYNLQNGSNIPTEMR